MKKKSSKDYQILGAQVATLFELGAPSRKTMLWNGFLRGMAQGLGAVIGGTLLVTVLIWVLSLFNDIPLIGKASDVITQSIHK